MKKHGLYKLRKNRAQSILEYAILIGVIAAALSAMQIYFRRGIQAVIRVAADEVGCQTKGLVEYDYKNEWKKRGASDTDTTVDRQMTSSMNNGESISYDSDETTTRTGILSHDIIKDE